VGAAPATPCVVALRGQHWRRWIASPAICDLWRWLPAAVVLAGGLIYAWVVGGAPGTVWLTGARVDLPAGEIAYPGRDHLERVDPMGSLPAPPLKEAVDTRAEEDVGSRR